VITDIVPRNLFSLNSYFGMRSQDQLDLDHRDFKVDETFH